MTRKIFKAIFTAAISVFAASLILISACIYDWSLSTQSTLLDSELALAAQGVEASGMDYFDGLKERNVRLTWIDKDGNVIKDTAADEASMENHSERKEISDALSKGFGEDTRYSKTLMEKTTYLASRLPDGTVLRCSVTQNSIIPMMIELIYPVILIVILAVVLAAVFAARMSKKIVKPLNFLDLEHPLENDAYDELAPFLTHMEQQNRRIASQFEEIRKNQTEFDAVTGNMNEGLVVLNDGGKILSINNAAKRLFKTGDDCVGRDFYTVERSPEVMRAIEECKKDVKSEASLERDGAQYRLNISSIRDGERMTGIVILAFDVTDKVFAEKNRREFTANVSHELKTPLQSILGSTELIEAGLVKKEDTARFVGNIRREASRLVVLIDDIIRLSQLDEKRELPRETVDLYKTAQEVRDELVPLAEKKNVALEISGESTEIVGVKRLVYELIYNLTENAVKYNVDGGRVSVSVTFDGEKVRLTVKDTGIGIPPEHLQRVFERFYRVDKSRSKETGGTGLGLSIVKHAAEYLGGEIKLSSEVGKGTEAVFEMRTNNL